MRIILEVSTRDQKVIHLLTRLLEGGGALQVAPGTYKQQVQVDRVSILTAVP